MSIAFAAQLQPGWQYLPVGLGSGYLVSGGSYVTLVAPFLNDDGSQHFAVIIEKLEGACLRCSGDTTQPEEVTFTLEGALVHFTVLSLWSTNQTDAFVQLPNITVVNGTFTVLIEPDTIFTVGSTFNQSKGVADLPIPPLTPFPFPYEDNFDNYTVDNQAHYFADDGGCFLIANAPEGPDASSRGLVLQQFVINQAGVNAWVPDTQPITMLGNPNWTDYT